MVYTNRQYNLNDVSKALRNNYNDSLSVYEYGDYVRLTNGSAGFAIDIYEKEYCFLIIGERYGEEINKKCNRTIDDLLETLSKTI